MESVLLFEPSVIFSFLAVSLLIAITPGPSWLLVINATMEQGWKTGLLAIVGNSCGIVIHTLSAAAGLSAMLYLSPTLFSIVQYAGALYLIYLGYRIFKGRVDFNAERPTFERPTRRILLDAVLVNVTNPKMLILMFSLLPQFVDPSSGKLEQQILVLGLIHTLSSIASLVPLAFFSDRIFGFLRNSPRANATFRTVTSALLVTAGLRLGLVPL